MASLLIVWGFGQGFGRADGLLPGVRLGVVSISWCRGHWGEVLKAAAIRLRGER